MLVVKVINEFMDKHTKELRKKGSSFSCEMERFKEIQQAGNFVTIVDEVKDEQPEKATPEKATPEKATKTNKRKDK